MKAKFSLRSVAVSASVMMLSLVCAHAATINKANNIDALNLTSSWVGGLVPGATDLANWNATVTGANTVALGANASWGGISVVDPGGSVQITGAETLTLGNLGIDLSLATQDLTIASNLTLSNGGHKWLNATGRTITLSTGTFTRSATSALHLDGLGTVTSTMTGLANTNNILGPWATVGTATDTRFVTKNGSNALVPFTTATAAANFGWPSGNNNTFNYDVAGVGAVLGIARQANTVRYTGVAATQNYGSNNTGVVTLNGLLNAGSGALTLSENGGVNQGQVAIGTNNGNQLVLGAANADLIVKIPIVNTGANVGSLLITGPKVVNIDSAGGNSTYTGNTTVASGTLLLSGIGNINASSGLTVRGAGAKYTHTSTVASTLPVTLGRGEITGTGTLASVTVEDDILNTISNGNNSAVPLTLGSLSFQGDALLNATMNGTAAPYVVTGALSTTPANGKVSINVNSAPLANGTYDLITASTFSGSASDFLLTVNSGINSRQSAGVVLNGSNIAISVNGDTPKWTGAVNGNWTTSTISSPKNWKLITANTATDFLALDNVLFDDTATGSTALELSDGDIAAGVITFNNNSKNYSISSTANYFITQGSLVKNGTGTLTIATSNTFNAATTFSGGRLHLENPGALGGASLNVEAGSAKTIDNTSGSALTLVGNFAQNWNDELSFAGTNDLDMGNGAVTLGGLDIDRIVDVQAGTLTVGEIKSTVHGLIKQGSGTLVLSSNGAGVAASVLAGPLQVSGGTVQINRMGSDAVGSGDLTVTGLDGTGTISNGSAAQRWLFVNAASDQTFSGTLTDGGTAGLGLNKQGTAAMTLNGTLSYTGQTTVEGGTLTISAANAAAGTLAVINNGILVLNHPQALGTASTIRLAGNNVSKLDLATDTGNHPYGLVFGTTTIATIIANRATDGEGINHTLSTLGINGIGGGILTVEAGNKVTSGTARLTLTELGLSAGSVQTTAINPTNASVSIGNISKVANAPVQTVELGGATADNFITGTIANGTATVNLIKSGSSTWTISSVNNTFTGTTTIGTANGAGILKITASGALGTGTILFDGSGGAPGPSSRLELSGDITLANAITLYQRNNTSSAILSTSGNNTLSGTIDLNVGGASGNIDSDAGLLTLSGPISTTTVASRTLRLGGAGNGVVSGVISNNAGTVNLIKAGAGTWTLSAVNTYTGTTSVNEGTLVISTDSPATTGAVSVAASATLAGNGDVGGAVIIGAEGRHALDVAATPGAQVTRNIGGVLDLSAVGDVLSLEAAAAPADGTYVLASATGGITGGLTDTVVQLSGVTGTVSVVDNDLVLTVGAVASVYDNWASANGLNPATTGLSAADPDGDGKNNALEFVLGGSPVSGGSLPKIYSLIADSDANIDTTNELVMTIAVPQGTPAFSAGSPTSSASYQGMQIVVKGSETLAGFPVTVTPVSPVTAGLPAAPTQGGVTYEYRSFSLGNSNGTATKGFMQVEITAP